MEDLDTPAAERQPGATGIPRGSIWQVQAERRPAYRVEGVDEGVLPAGVERVLPASAGCGDPRDRLAAHRLVWLRGDDDRIAQQAARAHVVGPHGVAAALRVEALDQVERGGVRR